MKESQNIVTKNYLQFCYTCQDAHLCVTEQMCQDCWEEKGMPLSEDENTDETKKLLREYAQA